mgnify:CR=1 FL=1
MTTILGLSGSLRRASFNASLLRAASGLMPEGATLQTGSIAGVPLYNADDESASGIPEPVARLKDALMQADGLLVVTPEYNNSLPGVFKNAIDWLSRPGSGIPALFGDRPVAVIGASPGGFGTILAQNAWLPVLRTLGCRHWAGGRLLVSRAGQAFDPDGTLQDEKVRGQLAAFVAAFAADIR